MRENSTGKEPWPYPAFVLHALLLPVGMFVALCAIVGLEDRNEFARENGVLENVQALLLVVTAIAGGIAWRRCASPVWSIVSLTIACVAVGGWAREMQSCESAFVGEGFCLPRAVKHTLISTVVAVLAVRWIHALVRQRSVVRAVLSPQYCWSAIPFFSCIGAAELAEEAGWLVAEEFIEAYAFSMLATINTWGLWKMTCPLGELPRTNASRIG